MKRCTACGEEKPLSAFSALKRGRGGKQPRCKACLAEYVRCWKQANPERVAVYRERQKGSMLRSAKRYRERNVDKVKAWNKAKNERVKSDPVRLAKKREADKRWRRENPEKFRAQQLAQNNRRRESRRAMRSDADVRAYALVLYGDPCSYCGGSSEHMDHIAPHAHGGLTVWENLTAACGHCNRSKRDLSLLAFLARP